MRRGGTNQPQVTQMKADAGRRQENLRKSGSSADTSVPQRPREIEVHIEELVLHGFRPNDRWRIGDAIEEELRGLLVAHGLPGLWGNNPERIDAGRVRLTNQLPIGAQIAGAIHGGAKK